MAKSFQQTRKPKSQKKKNKNIKGVQDGGVHKPKEVKTNLKHINLSNKMKTEAVDSQFNQLKEEMMGGVKTEVKSKKKVKGAPSDVKMEDCKYPVTNETNVKYESTDVTMETTIAEMGKLGAGNT